MPSATSPSTPAADAAIPRPALLLGLAGLVPFWVLAALMSTNSILGMTRSQIGLALVAYAAVIVSFLGGIRWGLATGGPKPTSAQHYQMAVVPSLVAWATLALPIEPALLILGVFTLVLGPVDRRLVTEGLAPPWYGRLRLILSTGAGGALLLAGFLAMRLG